MDWNIGDQVELYNGKYKNGKYTDQYGFIHHCMIVTERVMVTITEKFEVPSAYGSGDGPYYGYRGKDADGNIFHVNETVFRDDSMQPYRLWGGCDSYWYLALSEYSGLCPLLNPDLTLAVPTGYTKSKDGYYVKNF